MKILHISSAKTWRGGEQQIAYLIEELRQKDIAQHVYCVHASAMANWCKTQQIPYTTYQKRSSVSPSIARKLAQTCKREVCSLLHAHDSHAHTYACIAASLFRCKVPIILHRRVDFPVKSNPFSAWKYNHPAIARIICVSSAIQRILAASIKDQNKIQVVHSGVDLSRFQYRNTGVLRKEYHIPESKQLIGNVAAIAGHKDYFTFVDTVEVLVKNEIKAVFFIIGGDGGEQAEIEEYIFKKNLQTHIILTGFREDIPRILPELDLFLFTSKEEGLGTSVLDAFAAKVPVVSTNAGGIPEMVQDRITGLLNNIGDAQALAKSVMQLIKNDDLREKLIQNASEKLMDFTKEKMASQIVQIYQEIMSDLRP